jgi:molybdopterin-guanine dinucleotide biosynthesis protein A
VGGQARRLGGLSKGLIRINNQSLMNRTIQLLTPYCNQIVLLGNSTGYGAFNLVTLPDAYKDTGPLSGLAAGLDITTHEVLIVPCDLPHLTSSVLSELISHCNAVPVACRGPQRTHPLIACYPKSARDTVHTFARKSGSAHQAFKACAGRWINFDSEAPFTNINTAQDLADSR